MDWTLYIQLSAMMFLQYAIWGAWAPVLAAHLLGPMKMSGKQTGWIYATLWIACIFAPFVAGQLADRYVSSEWVLAVAHLVGGVVLLVAARQQKFAPLLVLMFLYSLLYASTLTLTNSVMFHQLKFNKLSDTQAGLSRVWGTIGWIVAGLGLTLWRRTRKQESRTSDCLVLTGLISLLMGALCFLLPHTPPKTTDAWLAGSAYNKSFDAGVMVKIEGTVESVDSFYPSTDATEGIRVQLSPADGNMTVDVGPKAYAVNKGFALKKGDQVLIIGSRTKVGEVQTVMATEVRKGEKGDQALVLRDASGSPTWQAQELIVPMALSKVLDIIGDNPQLLIFLIISFVVTTELQFYYVPTAPFLEDIGVRGKNVPAVMTLAQWAEILGMALLLPLALKEFPSQSKYQWILTIGVLAWPIRYVIFSLMKPLWLVVASLTCHGIGYTFFFFAGQQYVDSVATDDTRATMQAMNFAVTVGLGNFIGTQFTGVILDHFKTAEGRFRWRPIFLIPCALTVACAIAFLVFFRG